MKAQNANCLKKKPHHTRALEILYSSSHCLGYDYTSEIKPSLSYANAEERRNNAEGNVVKIFRTPSRWKASAQLYSSAGTKGSHYLITAITQPQHDLMAFDNTLKESHSFNLGKILNGTRLF